MNNSHNIPSEEDRFSHNIECLGDFLLKGINELQKKGVSSANPHLVSIGIAMMKAYNKHDLINGFVSNSHMYWDKIKDKDKSFFIENANSVWQYIPSDKVQVFKQLFTAVDENGKMIVPESLIKEIEVTFDGLVRISIKYINRENKKGNVMFPQINVVNEAVKWNIKL